MLSEDGKTSLKFARKYKDILMYFVQEMNANFRWNLKQKQILDFILEYLIVDNSLEDLLDVKIINPIESNNDPKISLIISQSTKEKFDSLVNKMKFVSMRKETNNVILTSTPLVENKHVLKNEEYLAIFIYIFQNHLKTKKLDDVFRIYKQIYASMKHE